MLGLFTIGTSPAARGRGIVTELTYRMIDDGVSAGARWAYLQSSEMAQSLYRRLYFVDRGDAVTHFFPERPPRR